MSAVKIIEDNSLRATDYGFEVAVRFKWYRSLPLSCVEDLQLRVDGQAVDPELIRFCLNGHAYRLDEMVDLVEEFWFILDSAVLQVRAPGFVKSGEPHHIEVSFAMRIPYIAIGPGRFMTLVNQCSVTQTAA